MARVTTFSAYEYEWWKSLKVYWMETVPKNSDFLISEVIDVISS